MVSLIAKLPGSRTPTVKGGAYRKVRRVVKGMPSQSTNLGQRSLHAQKRRFTVPQVPSQPPSRTIPGVQRHRLSRLPAGKELQEIFFRPVRQSRFAFYFCGVRRFFRRCRRRSGRPLSPSSHSCNFVTGRCLLWLRRSANLRFVGFVAHPGLRDAVPCSGSHVGQT